MKEYAKSILSVVPKLISVFLLGKIIALTMGPVATGWYGFLDQILKLSQTFLSLSASGFGVLVLMKYKEEREYYKSDYIRETKFTTTFFSLFASALVIMILLIARKMEDIDVKLEILLLYSIIMPSLIVVNARILALGLADLKNSRISAIVAMSNLIVSIAIILAINLIDKTGFSQFGTILMIQMVIQLNILLLSIQFLRNESILCIGEFIYVIKKTLIHIKLTIKTQELLRIFKSISRQSRNTSEGFAHSASVAVSFVQPILIRSIYLELQGAKELGYYEAAYSIPAALFSVLLVGLSPYICNFIVNKNVNKSNRSFHKSNENNLNNGETIRHINNVCNLSMKMILLVIALYFPVLALGKELMILIYSEEYIESVAYIPWIMIIFLATASYYPISVLVLSFVGAKKQLICDIIGLMMISGALILGKMH